ncbi:hypothetical protein B0H11DRAFT_213251 [Mycena galericulata]|nr:hypothetical protein B0H11DRAFT_213251 [Mycena galericulata]
MVESSLANWDGSKSSANQNVPTPTAIPTTMPASISDSHPHPAISEGPYRGNHNQNAHRATGNSSRAALHMAIAGSTGGLPHALANSLSTPSASSPALAPKPPPSTPTRITRTDIGLPAPPLHFGAPREILTTPASPHDPAPPWLRQSPSPKNGLIPMDVGMQVRLCGLSFAFDCVSFCFRGRCGRASRLIPHFIARGQRVCASTQRLWRS